MRPPRQHSVSPHMNNISINPKVVLFIIPVVDWIPCLRLGDVFRGSPLPHASVGFGPNPAPVTAFTCSHCTGILNSPWRTTVAGRAVCPLCDRTSAPPQIPSALASSYSDPPKDNIDVARERVEATDEDPPKDTRSTCTPSTTRRCRAGRNGSGLRRSRCAILEGVLVAALEDVWRNLELPKVQGQAAPSAVTF